MCGLGVDLMMWLSRFIQFGRGGMPVRKSVVVLQIGLVLLVLLFCCNLETDLESVFELLKLLVQPPF